MELIVEMQGFRDNEDTFVAKEVAVVSLNDSTVGHWILLPSHSFEELCEKSRRVNNWLSLNYHGIEWYDGEANPKFFAAHLREITRHARVIYTRGNEKASYLRNLLARNIYNLEDISPAFNRLPSCELVGRCSYHAFRKHNHFHCALHNAYKLKYWLVERNQSHDEEGGSDWSTRCLSPEIDDDDVSDESYSIETQSSLLGNWNLNETIRESQEEPTIEEKTKDFDTTETLADNRSEKETDVIITTIPKVNDKVCMK